ncbi:MAG: hypothetical protein II510_05885 [Erysipelotrichales bacterium]|nr:hypothetical protein [Erysipelotrichales bacterium]
MKTQWTEKAMKMITVVLLAAVLAVALTACANHSAGLGQPANPGSQELEETEESAEPGEENAAASAETEEAEEVTEEEPKNYILYPPTEILTSMGIPARVIQTEDENKTRSYIYATTLEEMLVSRTLPPVEGETANTFFGENENVNAQPLNYSMQDVNDDGEEELLLSYVMDDEEQTPVMAAYHYDPQSETWKKVFSSHTPVRLFENGVMEADAAEETGLSGREVARVISRYNAETENYDVLGTVEPWDLRAFPGRFGEDAFPDTVDENGNGLVYFLYDADGNGGEKPVDEEEIETRMQELIRGEEILVEWSSLTREKVNSEFLTIFSE